MDHRTPLTPHSVLTFEGMSCHVEEVVGQGSNAIVYKGWYPDQLNPQMRHHVLIKELFPFHPQRKIWRDENAHIVVEPEAEEFWDTHRESFEAGNDVHLRLLADHPDVMAMGANLNSFHDHGTLYSVLGYAGGRSLQKELNLTSQDLRRTACRMIGLLNALEAFHKSGYLHLDISPDNIMLVGQELQEQIFLIDYNSARPIASRDNRYLSCKAGYTAPEVTTGNLATIGFASDLYSVAAVFYRCLTGRALTLADTLRTGAPDGQDSALLKDVPQTVSSLVRSILKKGLHTLAGKRYQSIGQMRQVFQELVERIDCVGVTHWSLWENGKRSVEEFIRINPSLWYLSDKDNLYPIRLEQDLSLERYLEKLFSPEGHSSLVLAQGGMGKTTLLLHTAALSGKRYSSSAPAIFYISLSGWNGSDTHYIRRQILMRLRFKKGENTFDSAMHALHQLMRQPLNTKSGAVPVLLLLLDGLNEIHDQIGPLVQEIHELSAMAGVRIMAASRSEVPALDLETCRLMPLNMEDVEDTLGRHGLLIPGNPEVSQLLRTPLILSLYLQAGAGGKQLDVQSEEELMQAYLNALLEKELLLLPENADQRWQIDAALNGVLPAIAEEVRRTGHALTEPQLLKVVESCWKLLHARTMRKVYPQWIGRTKAISGEAQNAEQWYGIVIHDLLWQRLGMLMRDAQGGYRVFHQTVEGYLAEQGGLISRRIAKERARRGAAAAAILVPLFVLLAALILPAVQVLAGQESCVPYDEEQTETVIENVSLCYSIFGNHLTQIQTLLNQLPTEDPDSFLDWYEFCAANLHRESLLTVRGDDYADQIDTLCLSGELVPWSGQPFNGESAKELVSSVSTCLTFYEAHLPLLKGWAQSDRAQRLCPDFPAAFEAVLAADAQVMSKLYYDSCYDHLSGGDSLWEQSVRTNLGSIPGYEAEPSENLEALQSQQQTAIGDFSRVAATVKELCRAEGLLQDEE